MANKYFGGKTLTCNQRNAKKARRPRPWSLCRTGAPRISSGTTCRVAEKLPPWSLFMPLSESCPEGNGARQDLPASTSSRHCSPPAKRTPSRCSASAASKPVPGHLALCFKLQECGHCVHLCCPLTPTQPGAWPLAGAQETEIERVGWRISLRSPRGSEEGAGKAWREKRGAGGWNRPALLGAAPRPCSPPGRSAETGSVPQLPQA